MENTSPSSLYARPRTYLTQNQKLMILEENRNDGVPISILARKHGIHPITIYQWKKKMDQDENELSMDRIKEILLENERLKKENKNLKVKVADLSIDTEILKDALDIVKKKSLLRQAESQLKSKNSKNTK